MGILKSPVLYGDCMYTYKARVYIGISNTNNLPAPSDLIENPYGKKNFFLKDATQKSAPLVLGFWRN